MRPGLWRRRRRKCGRDGHVSGLGYNNERPTSELEQARWKAALDWGLVDPACCVRPGLLYIGGRVGFVDSAREKNKARAVVEIYRAPLKWGTIPLA